MKHAYLALIALMIAGCSTTEKTALVVETNNRQIIEGCKSVGFTHTASGLQSLIAQGWSVKSTEPVTGISYQTFFGFQHCPGSAVKLQRWNIPQLFSAGNNLSNIFKEFAAPILLVCALGTILFLSNLLPEE